MPRACWVSWRMGLLAPAVGLGQVVRRELNGGDCHFACDTSSPALCVKERERCRVNNPNDDVLTRLYFEKQA